MNASEWDNAALTHSHNTHKEKEARELQGRINAYLAAGGKITVIERASMKFKASDAKFNGPSEAEQKKAPDRSFIFSENKPGLQ